MHAEIRMARIGEAIGRYKGSPQGLCAKTRIAVRTENGRYAAR
jgi:hypothetical protein